MHFEKLAAGTVTEAYKGDPNLCISVLDIKWDRFKGCDLLNVAWGAHSKEFMAIQVRFFIRHTNF